MNWTTNPDVIAQRLEGAMVLVNIRTDRILELNDTAASLLEHLMAGLSQREAEAALAREYGVSVELVRSESEEILRLLEAERVVMPAEG